MDTSEITSPVQNNVADQAGPSTIGVSRRRLAFRPQSLQATTTNPTSNAVQTPKSSKAFKILLEPTNETPSKVETLALTDGSTTPDQANAKKVVRRICTWSLQETMILYDGVKQVRRLGFLRELFLKPTGPKECF